jgi:hypothetical protein
MTKKEVAKCLQIYPKMLEKATKIINNYYKIRDINNKIDIKVDEIKQDEFTQEESTVYILFSYRNKEYSLDYYLDHIKIPISYFTDSEWENKELRRMKLNNGSSIEFVETNLNKLLGSEIDTFFIDNAEDSKEVFGKLQARLNNGDTKGFITSTTYGTDNWILNFFHKNKYDIIGDYKRHLKFPNKPVIPRKDAKFE